MAPQWRHLRPPRGGSPCREHENTTRDRYSEAEQARLNILDIAAQEFADKGLAGARVDEIADKINSSKRMIYYYFGGKEELYRAVLEQAYAKIRTREAAANYEAMRADEALKQYVGHTFDYHAEHPEFVRLVMNENIHYGAHIGAVPGLKERNHSVIATLQAIVDKGVKEGALPRRVSIPSSCTCSSARSASTTCRIATRSRRTSASTWVRRK